LTTQRRGRTTSLLIITSSFCSTISMRTFARSSLPLARGSKNRGTPNELNRGARFEWVVYAKRQFGGPHYLGRYTHRVAITNNRLIAMADGEVRFLWKDLKNGAQIDEKLADKACAIAAACAPYCHPRLHAIDAKIETALVVMTEDERRAQARQAIAEAFAERPLKLIEGEVIEADAAETLATEREVVGANMGRSEAPELTPWKIRTNSFS
jgi:hypothetical protein